MTSSAQAPTPPTATAQRAVTGPNFFIAGAPKAGTTAMAQYLSTHPSVFFSTPKELFYWNDDYPECRNAVGVHSLEAYLSYFASANPEQHSVIAEGSTTTLQSRTAIPNILKFNPRSKYLVMLRHPVETVVSMHGELALKYHEDEPDFETAWNLQEQRAAGGHLPPRCRFLNQLQYRDVAAFGDQLSRLFTLVPPEQRLVLLFDDFKADAATCYSRVLEFLELPHDGRSVFPKTNVSREYRPRWLAKLYLSPPLVLERPVRLLQNWYSRNDKLKRRIKSMVMREKPRRALRPEFREHLSKVFREDVLQAEELLGRDLSSWRE